MKLKIYTVNAAVLWVSATAALIGALIALLCRAPWWAWLIAAAVSFTAILLLSRFTFKSYVLFRIKPLYQLLLSKDIATSRLSEELRRKLNDAGADLVDDIEENLGHLISYSDAELERIKIRERERGEFLAAVSHEIRTPIFNIEGYTQTLLDGAIDDPEVNRKFLERTMRSVERLAGMTEDLEKISSYESGGAVMYKDYFDVLDMVHEVIDTNILKSQKKNVTVKVSTLAFPHNKPIIVYADRMRISQVLERIMENAIYYSHPGGTVTVGFIDMFDKILVEVTDNGIGIPAKDLKHVFDKFYRVDESRSRESGGSGLGLSGAKGIIDAHGENMTVRSEIDAGTTFSFTLRKREDSEK